MRLLTVILVCGICRTVLVMNIFTQNDRENKIPIGKHFYSEWLLIIPPKCQREYEMVVQLHHGS